jgi:hypothetical protein
MGMWVFWVEYINHGHYRLAIESEANITHLLTTLYYIFRISNAALEISHILNLIDVTLEVDACKHALKASVEFWYCKSTGVYSGVVNSGNDDS